MLRCDVAIAGGGPGGCAAALSLRAHAPGLSVVLAEASDYGSPRIGETLPPPALGVLEHLGVGDAFRAQGHPEAYGTAAAWGAPAAYDNDFLFAARGVGWHLDRAAFDRMLADQAERHGVRVLRGTRVVSAERGEGGWRLSLGSADVVEARFLVDATGAAAVLARRCGARAVVLDRLAGFTRFFRGGGGERRTLVEAFADGWWYTAPLPDGLRVVACMTDTDLAREMELADPARWLERLGRTDVVRRAVGDAEPWGEPIVRAARSRRLAPAAGADWLAVGDAASTFDPLSSQGVLKALRCGVFAGYAAGDRLAKGDETGLERYRRFVEDEFASYARTRARYYAEERRWPEREFWRRRQAPEAMAPAA